MSISDITNDIYSFFSKEPEEAYNALLLITANTVVHITKRQKPGTGKISLSYNNTCIFSLNGTIHSASKCHTF